MVSLVMPSRSFPSIGSVKSEGYDACLIKCCWPYYHTHFRDDDDDGGGQ